MTISAESPNYMARGLGITVASIAAGALIYMIAAQFNPSAQQLQLITNIAATIVGVGGLAGITTMMAGPFYEHFKQNAKQKNKELN